MFSHETSSGDFRLIRYSVCILYGLLVSSIFVRMFMLVCNVVPHQLKHGLLVTRVRMDFCVSTTTLGSPSRFDHPAWDP